MSVPHKYLNRLPPPVECLGFRKSNHRERIKTVQKEVSQQREGGNVVSRQGVDCGERVDCESRNFEEKNGIIKSSTKGVVLVKEGSFLRFRS